MVHFSIDQLVDALSAAGRAHHDYEQRVLSGERDELWPGFYAAYVLGRLGDFVSASRLSVLLEESPLTETWAIDAARHVMSTLEESS